MLWAPTARLATESEVGAAALKHGLFIYPSIGMAGKAGGDGVMVTPPFVIEDADIGYIVSNLRTALDEVYQRLS